MKEYLFIFADTASMFSRKATNINEAWEFFDTMNTAYIHSVIEVDPEDLSVEDITEEFYQIVDNEDR